MKKAWNKYWERAENFNTIYDAQEAVGAEKYFDEIKRKFERDLEFRTQVAKDQRDWAKEALLKIYRTLDDQKINIERGGYLEWELIRQLPHKTQENIKQAIDSVANAQKALSDIEAQVNKKWEPYIDAARTDFEKKSKKVDKNGFRNLNDILEDALDKDYSDEPKTNEAEKETGDEAADKDAGDTKEAAEIKKAEKYSDKVGKKSYFFYVLPHKTTTTFTPSNAFKCVNDAACYAWYNKGAVWDHRYKLLGAAAAIGVCAYAYKNPKILSNQNLEVVSKKMLDVSSKGFEQLVKGVDRCVQGLRWLAR